MRFAAALAEHELLRISWRRGHFGSRFTGRDEWRHLVRIRIYWIIGFSGFCRLVCEWQALVHISLGKIPNYGENRKLGRIGIL